MTGVSQICVYTPVCSVRGEYISIRRHYLLRNSKAAGVDNRL